jgi:antirestriction protein ArdC
MSQRTEPDIVSTVASDIIAELERGHRSWVRPWSAAGYGRPLRSNGEPFHGFNAISLWMAGDAKRYSSRHWLTYKQAEAIGAQIRRGERARKAIFYTAYTKTVETTDEPRDEQRKLLKTYSVFNGDQIDGLPSKFTPPLVSVPTLNDLPETARSFFAALPGDVRHEGNEACYSPREDRIYMPPIEAFERQSLYGATLAHEYVHWSGAKTRLARDLSTRFGSYAYAIEELVAELGSALLGADLGLPVDHLASHASYIGFWLRELKRDPRSILTIIGQSQRAANYLLDCSGLTTAATADEELAQAA